MLVGDQGWEVCLRRQDYKSLHPAVTMRDTLVNRHTDAI